MLWRDRFSGKTIAKYILATVVCVIAFSALQWSASFADPDSFYHARIASLMAERGLLYSFPWLSFTSLANAFTDQHLLYHTALVPLMWWFEPAVAAKIGQVIFLTLLTLLFIVALRSWKLPYSWLAVASLYLLGPFLFRVNLVKATPLAIGFLFAITMLLLHKRYTWACVVTVFYCWVHGGFILALVVAVALFIADTIASSIQTNRFLFGDPRPISSVFVGIAIGLIANPYFPQNIFFLWEQLVQIGFINYAGVIEVGAEWYPFSLPDLVAVSSLVLIAGILSIIIIIKNRKVLLADRNVWALFIISALLFVATLRSRRYIEYFLPFAWLWSCYILLPYIASGEAKRYIQQWKQRLGRWYYIFVMYFSVAIGTTMLVSVTGVWTDLRSGFEFTQYQAASEYIEGVASPGTVVFNADWDDFPILFYHNSSSYYIIGLDATFMYLHDQTAYESWRAIGAGSLRENVASTIATKFNAEYVFIDRDDDSTKRLNAFLRRDPKAELVFEDDLTRVYHIVK